MHRRQDEMQLARDQLLKFAKIGVYTAIAVIAMAWATDLRNAILVSLCWLAGFLNQFYIVRMVLSLAKRQEPIPQRHFVGAILAIGLDSFVIAFDYGLILAAAFVSFVIMDLLILRFR